MRLDGIVVGILLLGLALALLALHDKWKARKRAERQTGSRPFARKPGGMP